MSIGGTVRYDILAAMNRPTEPAAIAAEVRRLAVTGLTGNDIAVALRLDLVQVREMLAATFDEAAEIHRREWSR